MSQDLQESSLPLPPEPFLFRIPDILPNYYINFSSYGANLPISDSFGVLAKANLLVLGELDVSPGHDSVLASTHVWTEDVVTFTLQPTNLMLLHVAAIFVAGLMEWGHMYGFVEADMVFLERRGRRLMPVGVGMLIDSAR